MASVKITVLIKTDVKNLWSYLADFEKQKLWMIGLEKVVFVPQTNSQEPNPFIMTIKEGKKFNDYEVFMTPKTLGYKIAFLVIGSLFSRIMIRIFMKKLKNLAETK
jgi:hypothetical protein